MTRSLIAAALLVGACAPAAEVATTETAAPKETTTTAVGQPAATELSAPQGMTCWTAPTQGEPGETLVFSDQTEAMGLDRPLTGMHVHAAIWTDIAGDGRSDLFVGTFADRDDERYRFRGAEGATPDRMMILRVDGFDPDEGFPSMLTRTSGGVAVDLDLNGSLDLVLARNHRDRISAAPSTQVLANQGGTLVPVEDSGLPRHLGGRSVAVLDYNGSGLPDLFITEDHWSGGSSVLMRNEGGLRFADVTAEAGIPGDVHGLGVAAADFNRDSYPDLFVSGSNRLFLGSADGVFTEVDNAVFQWESYGPEDDIAGVSVADVNRNGWLDIVVGHHYNSTVEDGTRVPVRLYLNRGVNQDGEPVFEDVTEQAGLVPLPTKAPHVELNDFTNNGWPDLLTSASADGGTAPALFRHVGLDGDVPTFEAPQGLGSAQYWVAAPSADYDRDGRLDLFLAEWEPALPSLLLRNESAAGHWLQVSVDPELGYGLGWRVEVYQGGDELLGAREITVTQGYSAGVNPIAHFGLGLVTEVTVRLVPPRGEDPIVLTGVSADQHLRYPAGCG